MTVFYLLLAESYGEEVGIVSKQRILAQYDRWTIFPDTHNEDNS